MTTDFRKEFDVVRRWRAGEDWCVYNATILLIAEFVLTQMNAFLLFIIWLQVIVCILAVLTVVCKVVSDYLLYHAEEDKLADLLDNSYGDGKACSRIVRALNGETVDRYEV